MGQTSFFLYLTPVILISLTLHEYSHGYAAFLLGDNTAQRHGRLSFNPLRHLDVIGTLFIFLFHFGWAKPVPVDPRNFQNPRKYMMLVALAGPAANLVLALIGGFFLRMIFMHFQTQVELFDFFCVAVYVNVALAIFNLLPFFPLDGSSILKGLVPHHWAIRLTFIDKHSAVLLIGIFLMDRFLNTGIFARILLMPVMFVVQFLTQEAFPTFIARLS